MSSFSITTRKRLGLDPLKMKPSYTTYYSIGVEFSKKIPGHCTYAEVAKRFGMTKQNAYTASVVALGKLIYGVVVTVHRENLRDL